MFMLLMPVRGSTFDVFRDGTELIIEQSQDYVVIPQVDVVIEEMSFEILENCILEGVADDYSILVSAIEFEEFTSYSQDLNINHNTREFLLFTVNRPLANKHELIVYYNIDEGRMLYVNEESWQYSNDIYHSRPYYNTRFIPEVLNC